MWVYGLDWAGPGQRQVADACECSNEPSGSVKCGEFLDQLQISQLLEKDSAPRSKYCSRGVPTAFFPNIAPSSLFTTKSLCLIVCPFHEWRLFFCKVIFLLSPFEKLHHSLPSLSTLCLTFFSNTMFQTHLRPFLHLFLGSLFLIHKQQRSKYDFTRFFFQFQTKVIRIEQQINLAQHETVTELGSLCNVPSKTHKHKYQYKTLNLLTINPSFIK